MDTIAYNSARREVAVFEREARLRREHQLAMECRDCEDFLQLGINAYNWLVRAEDELRASLYSGKRRNSEEVSKAFDRLFHTWLIPASVAEKWITIQISRGYEPDNLGEFRDVCQKVRETVGNRDWSNVACESLALSEAEDW